MSALPAATSDTSEPGVVFTRRRSRRSLSILAVLCASMLILLFLFSFLAPLLPLSSPYDMNLAQRLRPPAWMDGGSSAFPLGTDHLGRSVLSRLLYSTRVSLTLSLVAVSASAVIGTVIGLLAGYFRGALGSFFMRVADVLQSMPFLVIAIALVAILGASLVNLIIILTVDRWVPFARMVYGQVLAVKAQDFVEGARSLGARHMRIIFRHVLPSVVRPVIVVWTVSIGQAIIAESSLSFLGLGVPPPSPSLGGMLADGRSVLGTAWWIATFPGLTIMLIVLLVNGLGEILRRRLDPRS